jgi:pyruvate dehydrogenase E2 component (dihydrolipoamide acetyltransferase)
MAVPIIMPRQGQSVESCVISKWHKKKGDTVKKGDLLFSYETDKAGFDEESSVDGIVLEIFYDEGEDVEVLKNLCVIGEDGEDFKEYDPRTSENNIEEDSNESKDAKEIVENSNIESKEINNKITDNGEKVFISPRGKNYAEKINVDYRSIKGTGANGRIMEKDIKDNLDSASYLTYSAKDNLNSDTSLNVKGTGIGGRITTDDLNKAPLTESTVKETLYDVKEFEVEKLSNIRKVIAKSMKNSLSSMAQLTLSTSFDATEILELRKKIKNELNLGNESLGNITLNDMIVYAVSRTLLKYKNINAHLVDDEIHKFKNANIGIATDTDRGLMVPTLFGANLKSLKEISSEIKSLSSMCKKGTINPDLLRDGTFTITNLGIFNVESFTPIINPPQVAILGVGGIVKKPKETKDKIELYSSIGLSLTIDHQAIDGAPAAKFLNELKLNLEKFQLMLLG